MDIAKIAVRDVRDTKFAIEAIICCLKTDQTIA